MKNPTILELLGPSEKSGDVGIEIEMESHNSFPYSNDMWGAEHDGSLRGSNMEYILKTPVKVQNVGMCLNNLKKHLENHGTKVIYTERAGVHVHVNVQHLTVEQVFRFALLYYCFEEILTRYCGPNREGNHFCLRVKDAEIPLLMIEKATRVDHIMRFNNNDYRYAALNFCSLFRFGSLEFRAMETQPDLSKIENWAKILVAFRDYSEKILQNRMQIAENMSLYGPDTMLKEIVGQELFDVLWYEGAENQAIDSLRLAQMAIFSEGVK